MRTYLLRLAVVVLLALVGQSRAEIDATEVASANPKATGATFYSGVAAGRKVKGTVDTEIFVMPAVLPCDRDFQLMQAEKRNATNIPHKKR